MIDGEVQKQQHVDANVTTFQAAMTPRLPFERIINGQTLTQHDLLDTAPSPPKKPGRLSKFLIDYGLKDAASRQDTAARTKKAGGANTWGGGGMRIGGPPRYQ